MHGPPCVHFEKAKLFHSLSKNVPVVALSCTRKSINRYFIFVIIRLASLVSMYKIRYPDRMYNKPTSIYERRLSSTSSNGVGRPYAPLFNPLSPKLISVKFLLTILMLIQPLRSWELRIWSLKVNFLDILVTSPQYIYRKRWLGQDRRICSLVLGFW